MKMCLLSALALMGCVVQGRAANANPFQMDMLGSAQYSHYNFTDVENPYDGLDAYLVLKGHTGWMRPRVRWRRTSR